MIWLAERAEAKRLARELGLLAETTREERARQAFAQMYDADGKDIDERTEMPADAMDDFMKSLRKEAGLEHPEEEEDAVGDV